MKNIGITDNETQCAGREYNKILEAALALAAGSRPKLQATSGKLQAASFKLDKKSLYNDIGPSL